MTTTAPPVKSGTWLLDAVDDTAVFTPEKMTEEHRLIARSAGEFAQAEVLPVLDRLEHKEWDLSRSLLRRCGEIGLLGVNVPEAYGGVELDKVSSMIVSDSTCSSQRASSQFFVW